MKKITTRVLSLSLLSTLVLSTATLAEVTFTELPVSDRVGGGNGWMKVSDNGVVVFAKNTGNGSEKQGFQWSKQSGVSAIGSGFTSMYYNTPNYVSISNDGGVTTFGSSVYVNGELLLTTNTGANDHLTALSPSGDKVAIKDSYVGPVALNLADQSEANLGDALPNTNYVVADFSNDGDSALLAHTSTNFYSPSPFYISNADGSLTEVDYSYGSIADLSGNGSTVIGRSLWCEELYSCTLISNAAGTFEIADGGNFPEALNYDGTVAVLSFRDYSNNNWKGMVWDSENGLRNIVDLLAAQNIDISAWDQVRMYDISDNGFYMVGAGVNPQGERRPFLIDATPQCSLNGLL